MGSAKTEAVLDERLMTIGEVAEHLGVDVRHVRPLVHERRIPFVKWGHLLRFSPSAIHDWLLAHTVHESSPTTPAHRRTA